MKWPKSLVPRRDVFNKGAPEVRAYILAPVEKPGSERAVTFLVDTGSAFTILSPLDARALGIPMGEADHRIRGFKGSETINCKRICVNIWIKLPKIRSSAVWCGTKTEIYADVGDDSDWGKQRSVLGRDMIQYFILSMRRPDSSGVWVLDLDVAPDSAKKFRFRQINGCYS